MKAIVPLFTATLFVLSSAFPLSNKIARVQYSNNFCVTLEYSQCDLAGYVHLCYTPGEGITRTLIILYACTYVYLVCLPTQAFHKSDLYAVLC